MSGFTIAQKELAKLPYVKLDELQGRVPFLLSVWDDTASRFRMWLPNTKGGLMEMKAGGEPAEADYLGRVAESETDLDIPFLDFMHKRACWPRVRHWISSLRDDIHNLAASLAKIEHFFECSEGGDDAKHIPGVSRFVVTEVEYIFVVCRSLFDILQEIVARLWQTIRLHDETANSRKRALKKSFRPMVLSGREELITAAQLIEKFALPEQLARFYCDAGPFFRELMHYRDSVIHGGGRDGVDLVLATPRGFGVFKPFRAFESFGIWKPDDDYNENVVALQRAVAFAVWRTIETCNEFAAAVSRTIEFPPDMAPEYRLFVRGYHTDALIRARRVYEGGNAWLRDPALAADPAPSEE